MEGIRVLGRRVNGMDDNWFTRIFFNKTLAAQEAAEMEDALNRLKIEQNTKQNELEARMTLVLSRLQLDADSEENKEKRKVLVFCVIVIAFLVAIRS